jgi:hypothetical protein
MPQLGRQGYTPVYCRVYDDPAGEIRRAALEAVGSPASDFPAGMPLQTLLPELAARSEQRLVVFVDQFEEIFIRHDHEARERFAASLTATLAEGKGRVRFVLSLREDFLARLSDFRERIPNIFHNEFRLAPLSEAESRAAIVEPARLLGLNFEPELVDRLIADLFREGVDPPQLQIVCDTLYDAQEQGEKRLTLKSYLALGETRKILGNYLERTLHEFPPSERNAARELLKSLVTSEKTKTVAQIADLARAAGRPEDEASKILADLSNRRLIRRVQREEGYWYELTHEYLVEEISRWLSEKEMQLKKLRELLEQAIRNHRNLGILMPAAQLRLVQAQEDDLNLSKEERQFIRASAHALTTRRTRIAIGAAGRSGALALMGAIGAAGDAPLIRPYLASSFGESFGRTQSAAVEALLNIGDCTAVGPVSNLLFDMSQRGAIEYIGSCGGRGELALLEQVARKQVSAGQMGFFMVGETIRSIYRIGGQSSIPAIEHIIAGMPPDRHKAIAVAAIFDPQIAADLRSDLSVPQATLRSLAARMLAERGDPVGLDELQGLLPTLSRNHRIGLRHSRRFSGLRDLESSTFCSVWHGAPGPSRNKSA